MLITAIAFFINFVLVLAFTPVVREFARRIGAVDAPDGFRRMHAGAIPRLGGVAIFAGFYLTIFVVGRFAPSSDVGNGFALAWRCLVPGALILALGIADDIRTVKPWVKLLVQVVAVLWLYYVTGVRIQMLSSPSGNSLLGFLSLPATILWVVLITNAFNVVDGVDGLASGVGLISIACLFLTSMVTHNPLLPVLTATLAGGLLAFLRYNFNPASVFLGDSGSLWLGFTLAVFAMVGYEKSATAITIAAPLATMGLPVVETATSVLRRFLKGQPFWQADGRHIHHQLLRKGLSPRRVALVLYASSGLCGLASLFLVKTNDIVVGLISVVLAFSIWLGIQHLGYSELSEFNNAVRRGLWYQRRIIRNCVATRKLADDLRETGSLADGWSHIIDVGRQLSFCRMELQEMDEYGRPNTTLVATCELEDCACAVDPAPVQAPDDWLTLSIHLRHAGRDVGSLTLWRRRSAPTIHSELALFVETLSTHVPRLAKGLGPCTEAETAPTAFMSPTTTPARPVS